MSAPQSTPTSGIPDRPISDPADDSLGRDAFADSIADSIISAPDGSTLRIGVYGDWGEGKTSVLALMQRRLAQHGHICIWLTPWTAATRDEFLDQLLRGVTEALKIDLGKFTRAK